AAGPPPGERAAQEGAAAEGGRSARPRPAHPRQEARLFDPGRRLAARRAGAVRPRDAERRHAATSGLLPARGRHDPDRPPRCRQGRPLAPALGPARVHPLVRAPCRARTAGPARAAPGGARPLTELPEFGLGYPGTDLRRRLVDAVLRGEKT